MLYYYNGVIELPQPFGEKGKSNHPLERIIGLYVSSMELIDKVIQFSGKSVPLKLVAKVMGKDYQFVKIGIIEGDLPIGCSSKMPDSSSHTTYISPSRNFELQVQ